jgi:SAM-dependent methyltransferase
VWELYLLFTQGIDNEMKYKYANTLFDETRYRRIIALLEQFYVTDDKTVVDLGAGNNAISTYIICRKRTKIDFNEKTHPDIVHDISENIPLPDDCCDVVIAGEILEHIYFAQNFLLEIKRILRKEGFLILSVPNVCSLLYRIAWLFGVVPPFAAKADHTYLPAGRAGGHVRDYSFRELARLLTNLNFHIIKSTTNGLVYKKLYIPYFLIPRTFGQKIIILAENIKIKDGLGKN